MGIFKKRPNPDVRTARATSEGPWPALPGPPVRSKSLLSVWSVIAHVVVGGLLMITGSVLEAHQREMHVIWHNVSTPHSSREWLSETGNGAPMATSDTRADGHSLTPTLLVVLLLKELGVACVVAAIVGMTLEKRAREHDMERHHRLQMSVAENAVFALFGLSHDREFVQAVVDTNLKAAVVRTNLTQTYKLRNLTTTEARLINPKAPEDALRRFLILDMEQHYIFKNVSTAPIHHEIPLAVARRRGAGASAVTGATYVSIGQKPLSSAEIEAGIDKGSSEDHYLRYVWKRYIPAHGTLQVVANVACLKERSDNEVWGSFFPTMGEVSLTLEVLDGMNFGLRPISNADMKLKDEVPSTCRQSWVLSGPLLRHNSAVFWWRTYADDGLAEDSAVSAQGVLA